MRHAPLQPEGAPVGLIAWVLRVLALLLVLRLVLRFVAGVVRGLRGEAPREAGRASQGGVDLVRDDVCHTFVPRPQALQATIAGRTRHFCSPACRDKALAAAR
jgi:hypothetical protein